MKTAVRLVPQLAGAVVVLVVLLAIHKLPTDRVLAIFVVLIAAIALRELVYRFRESERPEHTVRFERALRRRPEPTAEASPFARLERELELSVATAGYAHRRLVPLLRTAAAARLGTRYGVELERKPEVARGLVGEEAWAFLRPDRPTPDDRHAPGPRREEIAAVIGALESL